MKIKSSSLGHLIEVLVQDYFCHVCPFSVVDNYMTFDPKSRTSCLSEHQAVLKFQTGALPGGDSEGWGWLNNSSKSVNNLGFELVPFTPWSSNPHPLEWYSCTCLLCRCLFFFPDSIFVLPSLPLLPFVCLGLFLPVCLNLCILCVAPCLMMQCLSPLRLCFAQAALPTPWLSTDEKKTLSEAAP